MPEEPKRRPIDLNSPSIRARLTHYDRPHAARPHANVQPTPRPDNIEFVKVSVAPPAHQPQPPTHQAPASDPASWQPHAPAQTVSDPRQYRSEMPQRQSVDVVKRVRRPKIRVVRIKLMTALTVLSLVFGLSATAYAWHMRGQENSDVAGISERKKNDPDVMTGDKPIEVPPTLDMYKEFTVSSQNPRYLRIPALGVNARIRELNLDDSNQLQAPANVYDAGWYVRSAIPSVEGTTLISAHITGPNVEGVFAGVKKLQPGNVIEVEQGNGQKFRYKVVMVKSFEDGKYDLATAMRPVEPGKHALNLVTHGPVFNQLENKNDPRFVVYTVEDAQTVQ